MPPTIVPIPVKRKDRCVVVRYASGATEEAEIDKTEEDLSAAIVNVRRLESHKTEFQQLWRGVWRLCWRICGGCRGLWISVYFKGSCLLGDLIEHSHF